MKKIFIISGSALFVVLFFLGIYNVVFQKKNQNYQKEEPSSQAANNATDNQSLQKKQDGTIISITDGGILGLFMDKNKKQLLYYSASDGSVWQLGDDGKDPVNISATILNNIIDAQWSPDRNMAITRFNKDGKDAFYVYNYISKKSTQLKEGIDMIVWDGLGKKIIYKYFDAKTKKRSLNIANPDGSNWQSLVDDISMRNVSIAQIPLSSMISFWNAPSSKEETQLHVVGVVGGNQKVIFSGKFGADYLWSPDGSHALVSSLQDTSGTKMNLGYIDAYGSDYKDLGISTMASKCAWSGDSRTVYCGVPGDFSTGTTMPDDYINKKVFSVDTFWKINIQTGKKDLLVQPQNIKGEYDASNLILSSTESYLFFINRKDNKLYRISL